MPEEEMQTANGVTDDAPSDDKNLAEMTAIERIEALQKEIEEVRETAIIEAHADVTRNTEALAKSTARLAALTGVDPAPKAKNGRKTRSMPTPKAAKMAQVPDGRPLSTRILGYLRHSKEAQRSEQIGAALSEDSKVVSVELRKLREAGKVEVASGQKRSSAWALVTQ